MGRTGARGISFTAQLVKTEKVELRLFFRFSTFYIQGNKHQPRFAHFREIYFRFVFSHIQPNWRPGAP